MRLASFFPVPVTPATRPTSSSLTLPEYIITALGDARHATTLSPENANFKKRDKRRRPTSADFAKRKAGMIEGAPDLSSREGFGA